MWFYNQRTGISPVVSGWWRVVRTPGGPQQLCMRPRGEAGLSDTGVSVSH